MPAQKVGARGARAPITKGSAEERKVASSPRTVPKSPRGSPDDVKKPKATRETPRAKSGSPEEKGSRAGTGTKGTAKKGGTSKTGNGAKRGNGADDEPPKLLTSTDVRTKVQQLKEQATELDTKAEQVISSTFERRLGAALITKAASKDIADLVRDWDRNKDGDISKIELRASVRNSLALKANNEEIDAFFASMDADGGGSLDLSELKIALKQLRLASLDAQVEQKGLLEEAEELRQRAGKVQEVAAATEVLESADAELKDLRGKESVEEQLGAMVVKRNLKVGEVITKWDKDGDGTVSKKEFAANVKEIGVFVTDVAEIDKLFDSYDDDGGGTLSLEELKPTLKQLMDAAAERNRKIKELSKSTVMLRKEAFHLQREMANEEARAIAKVEAKAADEAKAAKDKVEAEAKARADAKAAKEAAAAAKAKDKEEFDSRIAARRAAQKSVKTDVAGDAIKDAAGGVQFDAKREWKVAGATVAATVKASLALDHNEG